MILYNVKVEKLRNILQSCNLQIFLKKNYKKIEVVEKNLRNKRERKKQDKNFQIQEEEHKFF